MIELSLWNRLESKNLAAKAIGIAVKSAYCLAIVCVAIAFA